MHLTKRRTRASRRPWRLVMAAQTVTHMRLPGLGSMWVERAAHDGARRPDDPTLTQGSVSAAAGTCWGPAWRPHMTWTLLPPWPPCCRPGSGAPPAPPDAGADERQASLLRASSPSLPSRRPQAAPRRELSDVKLSVATGTYWRRGPRPRPAADTQGLLDAKSARGVRQRDAGFNGGLKVVQRGARRRKRKNRTGQGGCSRARRERRGAMCLLLSRKAKNERRGRVEEGRLQVLVLPAWVAV